jgi:hypothetical protein
MGDSPIFDSFDDFDCEWGADSMNYAVKVYSDSTGVTLLIAQPRKTRIVEVVINDSLAMQKLGSFLRRSLVIMAENFGESIAFVETRK